MLKTEGSNSAIITKLCNVRDHPNADRLKLATVLGTQVIVDLNAKDGDLVIYFDSNLQLSHEYLHWNNLYSNKELNCYQEVKGYFGKNGRVRAQRFRGEISNGYVAEVKSLNFTDRNISYDEYFAIYDLKDGDEFTQINGVEICSKYVVPVKYTQGQPRKPISTMFHRHWDTKQLMRELDSIPADSICYIEEKIHGTSGRTGNVICKTNRPWWKFWKPKEEWKVVSGTRRVDKIGFHLPEIREEIEKRVAPHLHKGEQIYYEIYGNTLINCRPCHDNNYKGGVNIQKGYSYGCKPVEFKAVLYRVTFTTPDGFCIDMDREFVYNRAEELGLEKPYLFHTSDIYTLESDVNWRVSGKSAIDADTMREGVVVWFKNKENKWTCLKYKNPEFLIDQDKRIEKEQTDIEDEL